MQRQKSTDKLIVLGVDGLDPRFTKRMIGKGKMPNIQKFIERGAQREDLVLLGSQPTVTPPQWTTLATGANPVVHGITQFYRHTHEDHALMGYNIDSRFCKAEPMWNCFAEAGIKTCVFHWPGSSWPPTSDSSNLMVIDGTGPGAVGVSTLQVDTDLIIGASTDVNEVTFIPKATTDAVAPCLQEDLNATLDASESKTKYSGGSQYTAGFFNKRILISGNDGYCIGAGGVQVFYDVQKSPIKDAVNWANAPKEAKEFTLLLSGGLLRRPCLILKDDSNKYSHVQIFKSKKDTQPLATLYLNQMVHGIIDEAIKNDTKYIANRNMILLSIKEDGSDLKMFVSGAYDIENDAVFHPKELHEKLFKAAGPCPPTVNLWTRDEDLTTKCMLGSWDAVCNWYVKAMHYLIEKEDVHAIFSHMHNIDLQEHTFIRYMKDHGHNKHSEETYEHWLELVYEQTDQYLGEFYHLLDEDWTVIITSDHAQVCPEHEPPLIGDQTGSVCVGVMRELGYTEVKKDKNGNDLKEIDWSKTKAVAWQGNDIFINLKGRNPEGIVAPEDQYELEEQIITDLYGYRDKTTGKRVIALALHKKDAILLGYGGETAGDIFFATAEGYNYDHCDGLSTTYGVRGTSLSPIFIAAGKGLKKSFTTDRIIRQVDIAPTCCVLAGVRMPAQCEGAPVYQILEEEF